MDLKPIIAVCALVHMWGCASRGVHCDGRLQPINPPSRAAEATAEHAKPTFDAEAPDVPEARDD